MDVLSDVLQVIRMTGAVFLTADFSSPWALESLPASQLMSMMVPGARQCVIFHVLADGRCWIKMEGHEPVELNACDVIVFPHGDVHVMCSGLELESAAIIDILPRPPYIEIPHLIYGGGGDTAKFVCGYLHCDQRFNPIFLAMPKLITVRVRPNAVSLEPLGSKAGGAASVPPDSGTWLENTVRYMITEATHGQQGNSALLARLAELLFVETLRLYMQRLPEGRTGWFAALKDAPVGKALELMHAEPAKTWTVKGLARSVGVSRSILAERFKALIAESPMHYLAGWRMELAKQMLTDGTQSIPDIAGRVGYRSEFAFSRAFKRHTGEPPAKWRRIMA
jgi:AraC-like DNA-binding protein